MLLFILDCTHPSSHSNPAATSIRLIHNLWDLGCFLRPASGPTLPGQAQILHDLSPCSLRITHIKDAQYHQFLPLLGVQHSHCYYRVETGKDGPRHSTRDSHETNTRRRSCLVQDCSGEQEARGLSGMAK